MAIATTTLFNPDQGDIIEEAFELAGIESRTGNDIRTARRSLNLLTLEWANKGINLWVVEEASITAATITVNVATYDIPIDTISILDAVIRTDAASTSLQRDIIINPISSSTYAQIPTKLQTGRPTQYYYNRIGIQNDTSSTDRSSTVTFWPVPDATSTYTFVYWRIRRIADAGSTFDSTMEIPDRFLPALHYGLAAKIAFKKNPVRFQGLNAEYRELFMEAADEDRTKETLRMVPDLSSYDY